MEPAMCGSAVNIRRCSSANLGSGTALNFLSMASCAAESRYPASFCGALDCWLNDIMERNKTDKNRARRVCICISRVRLRNSTEAECTNSGLRCIETKDYTKNSGMKRHHTER